jgi:hypothetical protein
MQSDRIAVSNLRPSVIGGKCLAKKITISFLNIWFFIFWQNSFILPHKEEVNRKMPIINEDTGLNISRLCC